MIIISRKNDRLMGAISGTPFNIPYTSEKNTELKMLAKRLEESTDKAVYASLLKEAAEAVVINFNEEVAAANGFLMYRKNTKTYHLVINKGTKQEIVSKDPLPQVLADYLIESFENNDDFMPILLAWRRFLTRERSNPEDAQLFANYITATFMNKEEQAKFIEEGLTPVVASELATFKDLSITTYGLLATFKVVTRVKKIWKLEKDKDGVETRVQVDAIPSTKTIDPVTGEITVIEGQPKYLEELIFTPAIHTNGDKFFCGSELGYKYQIGKEAVLPTDALRQYSNIFGGGGLYAGGLSYVDGYKTESRETLTCFIDPAEIISFQDSGRAFRVNRMFINGTTSIEGETEGMYFVSDYAAESNERMAERFEVAVLKSEELRKAKEEAQNTSHGLISDVVN